MILKVSNAFLTETHSSVWVLSIGKTLTQHCMGVFLVTGSRRLLCYLALNTQTRTKGFYQYFSKFVLGQFLPQGVTPGLEGEGRYLEKTSPIEGDRILLSSWSFSYSQ